MFPWKKRDDGFEWHKYVRTTIKLRREARRDRAHQMGIHVAEGARAAGAAADSIARTSARRLVDFLRDAASGTTVAARRGLGAILTTVGAASGPLARSAVAAADILGRPGVAGPLTFAGLIAVVAGGIRAVAAAGGLDTEALTALVIGGLCLALGIGPSLWLGHAALPSRISSPVTGLPSRPWLIAAGLAVVTLIGAILQPLLPWRPSIAGLPALPFVGSQPVTGKAAILAADLLEISGRKVRLSGLEAPDPQQRCQRPGTRGSRTWPCGQDAREATARLVQGKQVACEVAGPDAGGVSHGSCRAGGADIAEALVKAGHAFAETGLVSPYRSAEQAARAAKAGIWGAEIPERPAAWRDRVWQTAKRQAPDGCPIKGRIRGDERTYLLPWSTDYERVRLNKRRGERWFCTEDEAIAAGWRVDRGRG